MSFSACISVFLISKEERVCPETSTYISLAWLGYMVILASGDTENRRADFTLKRSQDLLVRKSGVTCFGRAQLLDVPVCRVAPISKSSDLVSILLHPALCPRAWSLWLHSFLWHHWLNGHGFEQTLGGSEGQGSLASCSPWGLFKELDTTEWLNTTFLCQVL